MKNRIAVALLLACVVVVASCASGAPSSVVVGAVYPTGGGQGPGGIEEYRGLRLAADLARREHRGPRIAIKLEPADSVDAAPGAVDRLAAHGARIIVGSYGSTISRPAALAAARHKLVFWETGAVGELMLPDTGRTVFRIPATGGILGGQAVEFIRDHVAPTLAEQDLRYTVVYVDDAYGRSVGNGALDAIRSSKLMLAAKIPYDLRTVDYDSLALKIADAKTDVLVVSAYLDDAIAMRRAIVRGNVPLLASIGTSSSYCMPAFGAALGPQAVGLYASDKPDWYVEHSDALGAEAHRVLEWGEAEYQRRYHEELSGAALSGLSSGWALFGHVLPAARSADTRRIAAAALATRLPPGSLPNGSGLELAPPGHARPGENLRASSVIWEWKPSGPDKATRVIVWPPAFATEAVG